MIIATHPAQKYPIWIGIHITPLPVYLLAFWGTTRGSSLWPVLVGSQFSGYWLGLANVKYCKVDERDIYEISTIINSSFPSGLRFLVL